MTACLICDSPAPRHRTTAYLSAPLCDDCHDIARDAQMMSDIADIQRRMDSCVTYTGRVLFGEVTLTIED